MAELVSGNSMPPQGIIRMRYYAQRERLPLSAGPPTPGDVYLTHMAL